MKQCLKCKSQKELFSIEVHLNINGHKFGDGKRIRVPIEYVDAYDELKSSIDECLKELLLFGEMDGVKAELTEEQKYNIMQCILITQKHETNIQ